MGAGRHSGRTAVDRVAAGQLQRGVRTPAGLLAAAVLRVGLAAEDEIPDPMARMRAPAVRDKPVPFFTSVELSELDKACRETPFAQRRDAVIVAMFRAKGILAGRAGRDPLRPLRCQAERCGPGAAGDPRARQWRQGSDRPNRSRGGPPDRPLPPRPRQARPGAPHRFRHHFSHTWLDRGGAPGDLIRNRHRKPLTRHRSIVRCRAFGEDGPVNVIVRDS